MSALIDHRPLRLLPAGDPRPLPLPRRGKPLGYLFAGLVILTGGLAISWEMTGHWVEIPSPLETISLLWLTALHLLAFACALGEGFGPLGQLGQLGQR
ncbi:MAG: hypothetical protein LWW86_04250 [Micrococcales bacterium]|nr:hypothetical protein [Micrococcales bacterium]